MSEDKFNEDKFKCTGQWLQYQKHIDNTNDMFKEYEEQRSPFDKLCEKLYKRQEKGKLNKEIITFTNGTDSYEVETLITVHKTDGVWYIEWRTV